MQRVRFVVEGVLASRGAVLCRRAGGEDFTLTRASSLGGRAVRAVDVPRKTRSDGSQDPDAFVFFLADPADAARFRAGEEVLLESS